MNDTWAIIGMFILICNLIVLGLNLKLYTEHFKDRAIARRRKEDE